MKNKYSNINLTQQTPKSPEIKKEPNSVKTNFDTKNIGITLLNTNLSNPKFQKQTSLKKSVNPK